jgi:hypothetical protein
MAESAFLRMGAIECSTSVRAQERLACAGVSRQTDPGVVRLDQGSTQPACRRAGERRRARPPAKSSDLLARRLGGGRFNTRGGGQIDLTTPRLETHSRRAPGPPSRRADRREKDAADARGSNAKAAQESKERTLEKSPPQVAVNNAFHGVASGAGRRPGTCIGGRRPRRASARAARDGRPPWILLTGNIGSRFKRSWITRVGFAPFSNVSKRATRTPSAGSSTAGTKSGSSYACACATGARAASASSTRLAPLAPISTIHLGAARSLGLPANVPLDCCAADEAITLPLGAGRSPATHVAPQGSRSIAASETWLDLRALLDLGPSAQGLGEPLPDRDADPGARREDLPEPRANRS